MMLSAGWIWSQEPPTRSGPPDPRDVAERSAALSLDAKAIEAVKGYSLKPAMFEDKPVPIEVRIVVNSRPSRRDLV